MARIYLHIGLNKTGTSSLQDFFHLNADALREQGVHYPAAGRDGAAHHALSKWLKSPKGQEMGAQAPVVSKLLAEIREADKVVLSSEDFHTHGPRSVERLAGLFAGHEVRVVLYLREHLSYLASWYQQNVQATHLSCAFDTFCYFTRKPLARLADQWSGPFGRQNVTVRLYDRGSLQGGDIVQDFAELAGLGGDLSRFGRKPYESNPSVSGNLLFAKRLLNNFLPKPQAAGLVDEVTNLSRLKPEFRGPMWVDAETAAYVRGLYKADREQLRNSYGLQVQPPEGELPGQRTPDLETLRADWDLIMGMAGAQGHSFARFGRLLRLEDVQACMQAA